MKRITARDSKGRAKKAKSDAQKAAEAHAARLAEVSATLPGGQHSMKDLLPDPVETSMQGKMEVVQLTRDTLKQKRYRTPL